jgi:hypothetical protein
MCEISEISEVIKNSQLMDYMLSLHFIDFISWGVLDNGPLYCITLWTWGQEKTTGLKLNWMHKNNYFCAQIIILCSTPRLLTN